MSDMTCKKTMQRCNTPGMCVPHGGCQPENGFEAEHLDLGKFVDWVWSLKTERDQLKAENEALREEVALDEKIIAERDRLLNMFECPEHGQCVPYAMEQVEQLRASKLYWVAATGSGLVRCVTDARYRKFSPSIRARYSPVVKNG